MALEASQFQFGIYPTEFALEPTSSLQSLLEPGELQEEVISIAEEAPPPEAAPVGEGLEFPPALPEVKSPVNKKYPGIFLYFQIPYMKKMTGEPYLKSPHEGYSGLDSGGYDVSDSPTELVIKPDVTIFGGIETFIELERSKFGIHWETASPVWIEEQVVLSYAGDEAATDSIELKLRSHVGMNAAYRLLNPLYVYVGAELIPWKKTYNTYYVQGNIDGYFDLLPLPPLSQELLESKVIASGMAGSVDIGIEIRRPRLNQNSTEFTCSSEDTCSYFGIKAGVNIMVLDGEVYGSLIFPILNMNWGYGFPVLGW